MEIEIFLPFFFIEILIFTELLFEHMFLKHNLLDHIENYNMSSNNLTF